MNVSKEGKNLVNSSWEIKTFNFWQWQQSLDLPVLELLVLAYFYNSRCKQVFYLF